MEFHFFLMLLMLAGGVGAQLTADEIDMFENNGIYSGSIIVDEVSSSDYLIIESNGLADHEMEIVNINNIPSENWQKYYLTRKATYACTPGCLPGGVIGITKAGVQIYNPNNSDGENAVEGDTKETFDSCNGHADVQGRYHYHQTPLCGIADTDVMDEFIGVALDGYPIYGAYSMYAANTETHLLTSAELDLCHGRMVDGKYRYHLTADYPYVLGCFMGTTVPNKTVSYDCSVSSGDLCTCSTPNRNPAAASESNYGDCFDGVFIDTSEWTTTSTTTTTTTTPTTTTTTVETTTRRNRKGNRRNRYFSRRQNIIKKGSRNDLKRIKPEDSQMKVSRSQKTFLRRWLENLL